MARIYLIGAVTGKPDDNRQEFERVRQLLRERGHKIDIPHDFIAKGTPWEKAMMVSINRITAYGAGFEYQAIYDTVAFLDDWEESSGARFEREVCNTLGIDCRSWREVF